MTNKRLQELLKQFPDELEVHVLSEPYDGLDYGAPLSDLKEITLEPNDTINIKRERLLLTG